MLLPSMNLPVMGKIAGVSMASLGKYLHSNSSKKTARWAEGFQDELNGNVLNLEKDGLCQAVLCA